MKRKQQHQSMGIDPLLFLLIVHVFPCFIVFLIFKYSDVRLMLFLNILVNYAWMVLLCRKVYLDNAEKQNKVFIIYGINGMIFTAQLILFTA
jgi:hypothetical protein